MLVVTNNSGEDLELNIDDVLARVRWQFTHNYQLIDWFDTLLSKKGRKIEEIIYGDITVYIDIFPVNNCVFSSPGQTRWDGVFTNK